MVKGDKQERLGACNFNRAHVQGDSEVLSLHDGPVLPSLNSCWRKSTWCFRDFNSTDAKGCLPSWLDPGYWHAPERMEMWRFSTKRALGVTICRNVLRIQSDSQAVHLVILYIPFVSMNYSVNIPTASESWYSNTLNFIVTLRSTHALVFNLFEETENSVATSNSVALKPFLVFNVLFPAYSSYSVCWIIAYSYSYS